MTERIIAHGGSVVKPWYWLAPLAFSVVGCHLCSPSDVKPTPTRESTASSAAPIQPGVIAISPANTSINFTGSTAITSQSGHFEAIEGTLEAIKDDPKEMRIRVVVNMESTTTKIGLLTRHLKGEDFFDVARYPKSEFELDGVSPLGEAGAIRCRASSRCTACNGPSRFPPA